MQISLFLFARLHNRKVGFVGILEASVLLEIIHSLAFHKILPGELV